MLPRAEVFLIPWTEEWKEEFLKAKQLVEKRIGENIVAVRFLTVGTMGIA
ncbi:hypothetical protein [Peribacillus loiseleuriae]